MVPNAAGSSAHYPAYSGLHHATVVVLLSGLLTFGDIVGRYFVWGPDVGVLAIDIRMVIKLAHEQLEC
jgi:hypothetical protein